MSEPLQHLMQSAVDWWLADSPAVRRRCAAMAGRCIGVDIREIGTGLCLRPYADGITVTLESPVRPDARIHASAADLLRALRGGATAGRLEISGDAELAQSLRDLFREVRFDPDERLAALIGDLPAHQIGRAFRGVAAFGRDTIVALGDMGTEYVQHEARLLPTRAEVEAFVRAVDDLRDGVERAAARFPPA